MQLFHEGFTPSRQDSYLHEIIEILPENQSVWYFDGISLHLHLDMNAFTGECELISN